MRIAILTETFPPKGASGVSSAHYNLYCLFKENNLEVKVFTFNDNSDTISTLTPNPDIFHYGISQKLRKQIQILIPKIYKYQRKIFYKTDTYLTAYQFVDIVIANLGSRKINYELQKFNPNVLFIPDHGVPGLAVKKIKNAKYIHICHHNPLRFINNPFFGYSSQYDAYLAVKIEKRALKKADGVICPSSYMKDVFVKTFGENHSISVIPNLIDNTFIEGIAPVSVHEKLSMAFAFPIVYIPSGGSSVKGERFVVEIIRRLAVRYEFKIGFYISGGLSAIHKEELDVLKVYSNLIYSPGYVENEINIGLIKKCTVCVSPTLIENFSMAILEANFCNVPVVTFDVGGNTEIIENGVNGFTVPYLDIETLIQKTCYILDRKEQFDSFGYVNERFSGKALRKKYLDYISRLMP